MYINIGNHIYFIDGTGGVMCAIGKLKRVGKKNKKHTLVETTGCTHVYAMMKVL